MNLNVLIAGFLLFIYQNVMAQKPYFQQEVNFNISVTLDDKKHRLAGEVAIDYTNHAPDPLSYIYFHLYPQAYSSRQSAYARQALKQNNTQFYFSTPKEMGGMTDLDFKADGQKCAVEIDPDNPDIAKVLLPKPLRSGEMVQITTPFKVKFPKVFSRMGHSGQQYCVTQWYPKPAVYDALGWHPMPYLDQGEFYSDFGNYDVSITLPNNYLVAATGVLQTDSEKEFLQNKIENTRRNLQAGRFATDTFPSSSATMKTIRFTAERVVDFAWFADKRFWVLSGDTTLQNGKKIDVYAYFPPSAVANWQHAPQYLSQAVAFYSAQVGAYPHPQATAVYGSEGFSGGMEYPMITLLTGSYSPKELDGTIAHEVGHNWFQGILAFNERDFAWLDEGINTFYERRYMKTFYPTDSSSLIPRFLGGGSDYPVEYLGFQRAWFKRQDQAISTTSNGLTTFNYYLNAYDRSARSLKLLEGYFGTAKFDAIMQDFYQQWQFKHPSPDDFHRHWAQATGEDCAWLFDDLIIKNKIADYELDDIIEKNDDFILKIDNESRQFSPVFSVTAFKNNKPILTKWYKGITEEAEVRFPKGDYDRLTLDAEMLLPDINRANNHVLLNGKKPLRLKWGLGVDNSTKNTIYWTPTLGINRYDGLMLGLALHNKGLPFKATEYTLLPMYAFSSKQLTGLGHVTQRIFKSKQAIDIGLGAQQFNFQKQPARLTYTRLTPSVTWHIYQPPTAALSHQLCLTHYAVGEQYDTAAAADVLYKATRWGHFTELAYSGVHKNALGDLSFKIAVENGMYKNAVGTRQNFIKTTLTLAKDFAYAPSRFIQTRLFFGGFPYNTGRERGFGFTKGQIGLASNGLNDYKYEGLFLGRNEVTGFASQQIQSATEGGMFFALDPNYARNGYFTNNFLSTLNLKADLPNLPAKFPIKPYLSVGYINDSRPAAQRVAESWLMTAGLAIEVGDLFGLYMPLYFSGDKNDLNSFRNRATARRFTERLVFNLNLKKLNPIELLRNIGL